MGPETKAVFLRVLARESKVRFSLTPTDISLAGREVTVGFELRLIGTHPDPGSSAGRCCRQCHRVLMNLLEFADRAVPTGAGARSRPDTGYAKLTRYGKGSGCDGQVSLVVRLLQTRRFEQASDGWAWDFMQEVRRFLLEQGCRQLEFPEETGSSVAPLDDSDGLQLGVLDQSEPVPTVA